MIMTKQQKLARLQEILDDLKEAAANPHKQDTEGYHSYADQLLCEALTLLGCEDIAKAYEEAQNAIGFWYA